jgi:D-alanyl-D-alanine carboxypeptidase/D-alanyl-D-alanine-endopeptidase (penicillin-binding protein 4)
MTWKKRLLLATMVIGGATVFAQTTVSYTTNTYNPRYASLYGSQYQDTSGNIIVTMNHFQSALLNLGNSAALRNADWGVYAVDVHTGEVVADYNAHARLTPASSMKTLTTAAALSMLGEGYTYKTVLEYDGEILADGTLFGNVYLKGSGDPTLGSTTMPYGTGASLLMQRMAEALRSAGITKIQGAVVGDDSSFDNARPAGWDPTDYSYNYTATATALNICDNSYWMVVNQSSAIEQARRSSIDYMQPQVVNVGYNMPLNAPPGSTVDEEGNLVMPKNYRPSPSVAPIASYQFSIQAMPEPAFFATYLLKQAIEAKGITVTEPVTTQGSLQLSGRATGKSRTSVYTHESPALRDIVHLTNEKSKNLYAEALLKTVGHHKYGLGSVQNGIRAVKEFWAEKGLDVNECLMEDGCGLSHYDNVSPFFFANAMKILYAENYFNSFQESLPLAGVTGTLEKWFIGTAAHGRIRAKTGTLRSVLSYTGFAPTYSGRTIAFSIIVNRYGTSASSMRSQLTNTLAQLMYD